jgi:hypothetical protein
LGYYGYSVDGTTFASGTGLTTGVTFNQLFFSNGYFAMGGRHAGVAYVGVSSNGINWSQITTSPIMIGGGLPFIYSKKS